jgi:hypothetical protein
MNLQNKIDKLILSGNIEFSDNRNVICALVDYHRAFDIYDYIEKSYKIQYHELSVRIAICYDILGNYQRTIEYLNLAMKLIPNVRNLVLYKSILYFANGDHVKGHKLLNKFKFLNNGLGKDKESLPDLFRLVYLYIEGTNKISLIENIDLFISKYNNYALAYYLKATLYLEIDKGKKESNFLNNQSNSKSNNTYLNSSNSNALNKFSDEYKLYEKNIKLAENIDSADTDFLVKEGVSQENLTKIFFMVLPEMDDYQPKALANYNTFNRGFRLFFTLFRCCRLFKIHKQKNKIKNDLISNNMYCTKNKVIKLAVKKALIDEYSKLNEKNENCNVIYIENKSDDQKQMLYVNTLVVIKKILKINQLNIDNNILAEINDKRYSNINHLLIYFDNKHLNNINLQFISLMEKSIFTFYFSLKEDCIFNFLDKSQKDSNNKNGNSTTDETNKNLDIIRYSTEIEDKLHLNYFVRNLYYSPYNIKTVYENKMEFNNLNNKNDNINGICFEFKNKDDSLNISKVSKCLNNMNEVKDFQEESLILSFFKEFKPKNINTMQNLINNNKNLSNQDLNTNNDKKNEKNNNSNKPNIIENIVAKRQLKLKIEDDNSKLNQDLNINDNVNIEKIKPIKNTSITSRKEVELIKNKFVENVEKEKSNEKINKNMVSINDDIKNNEENLDKRKTEMILKRVANTTTNKHGKLNINFMYNIDKDINNKPVEVHIKNDQENYNDNVVKQVDHTITNNKMTLKKKLNTHNNQLNSNVNQNKFSNTNFAHMNTHYSSNINSSNKASEINFNSSHKNLKHIPKNSNSGNSTTKNNQVHLIQLSEITKIKPSSEILYTETGDSQGITNLKKKFNIGISNNNSKLNKHVPFISNVSENLNTKSNSNIRTSNINTIGHTTNNVSNLSKVNSNISENVYIDLNFNKNPNQIQNQNPNQNQITNQNIIQNSFNKTNSKMGIFKKSSETSIYNSAVDKKVKKTNFENDMMNNPYKDKYNSNGEMIKLDSKEDNLNKNVHKHNFGSISKNNLLKINNYCNQNSNINVDCNKHEDIVYNKDFDKKIKVTDINMESTNEFNDRQINYKTLNTLNPKNTFQSVKFSLSLNNNKEFYNQNRDMNHNNQNSNYNEKNLMLNTLSGNNVTNELQKYQKSNNLSKMRIVSSPILDLNTLNYNSSSQNKFQLKNPGKYNLHERISLTQKSIECDSIEEYTSEKKKYFSKPLISINNTNEDESNDYLNVIGTNSNFNKKNLIGSNIDIELSNKNKNKNETIGNLKSNYAITTERKKLTMKNTKKKQ